MVVSKEMVKNAVLGGAVLAGGEGGTMEYGTLIGSMAVELGMPKIISLDELSDDAQLLEVSIVGSPAAKGRFIKPIYHVRSVNKFIEYSKIRIDALIANAFGGTSIVNGWLQSAALDIPVVDAVCNGRNSPKGFFGPMSVNMPEDYRSRQMVVGGNPENGTYVEAFYQGTLPVAASMARDAAVYAGGAVAVSRNPIQAAHAKKYASAGAISKAIDLGCALYERRGEIHEMLDVVCRQMGASIVAIGQLHKFNVTTQTIYDNGLAVVWTETGERYVVRFSNQYMEVSRDGKTIAEFPDLIVLISMETGLPLASNQLKTGYEVAVLTISCTRLGVVGEDTHGL